LEPGKTYRYRIVSKKIVQYKPYEVVYGNTVVSDIFEFTTLNPNKKEFSLGVVPDGQEESGNL